jgi:hypothetical protein
MSSRPAHREDGHVQLADSGSRDRRALTGDRHAAHMIAMAPASLDL